MINTDWAWKIPLPKKGWEYLQVNDTRYLTDGIAITSDDGTSLHGEIRMRTNKGVWVEWTHEIGNGRVTFFKRRGS